MQINKTVGCIIPDFDKNWLSSFCAMKSRKLLKVDSCKQHTVCKLIHQSFHFGAHNVQNLSGIDIYTQQETNMIVSLVGKLLKIFNVHTYKHHYHVKGISH